MLRKIQLSYFFRYLGDALFYPFMSLFLITKGINGNKLGLILGALPLIAIVANLFFSLVKINHKYDRYILYIMLLFEGILIFIYGFSLSFILYFILTLFIGFTNAPYYALLDSYTTRNYLDSKDYPRVRIMGSIAYIFGGAFGGILIDSLGYFYVFLIAFITYLISFLFFLLVKKKDVLVNEEIDKINYKETLNKNFIIYVIFYILLLGSNNVFDNYFNVYLEQLNFSIKEIGIINSLVIVSETIVMFIMIRVLKHKINYKYFLIFCGFSLALKNFVFYFNLPPIILISFSLLRGVGWGGILACNVNIIIKLVKQQNLTFALLFMMILMGVFRGVSNYIVGDIYQSIGFNTIFLSLAIIQIFAIFIMMFSKTLGGILNEKE